MTPISSIMFTVGPMPRSEVQQAKINRAAKAAATQVSVAAFTAELPPEVRDLAPQMFRYAAAALDASTWENSSTGWRHWVKFCTRRGINASIDLEDHRRPAFIAAFKTSLAIGQLTKTKPAATTIEGYAYSVDVRHRLIAAKAFPNLSAKAYSVKKVVVLDRQWISMLTASLKLCNSLSHLPPSGSYEMLSLTYLLLSLSADPNQLWHRLQTITSMDITFHFQMSFHLPTSTPSSLGTDTPRATPSETAWTSTVFTGYTLQESYTHHWTSCLCTTSTWTSWVRSHLRHLSFSKSYVGARPAEPSITALCLQSSRWTSHASAPPWLVPHWDFTASVDLAQHWPKSKAFQMISSSTWGAGGQTSSSSISASLKMIKSTSTLSCSSSTATVASSSLVSVATLTFLGLFVYTKATVRSFFGIIANNKLLCSRQPSLTRSSSA
jgi:hypothetical protein